MSRIIQNIHDHIWLEIQQSVQILTPFACTFWQVKWHQIIPRKIPDIIYIVNSVVYKFQTLTPYGFSVRNSTPNLDQNWPFWPTFTPKIIINNLQTRLTWIQSPNSLIDPYYLLYKIHVLTMSTKLVMIKTMGCFFCRKTQPCALIFKIRLKIVPGVQKLWSCPFWKAKT